MPKNPYPAPAVTLSKVEARRFMLAHQYLWPPRTLAGKEGILELLGRIGCIQFDPVDVVGWNPNLVLQSRVAGFSAKLLDEMLYTDRILWDGWDKMQAVYQAADWPYFARHRAHARGIYEQDSRPEKSAWPLVVEALAERGPLSSIDFDHQEKMAWYWGIPTRTVRAAMEGLYSSGYIGVHHRVGTRRFFERVEKLLPAELLAAPEPNPSDQAYHDWHALRRIGSMGLTYPVTGESWYGIVGMKTTERQAALLRLYERKLILPVAIDDVPERTFFMRAVDLPTLRMVQTQAAPTPRAALIAPLDNLIWQRDAVRWIFDFDYVWEVYKPAALRKYAHYALPVLYGDRFVARCEPIFERKTRTLILRGWWWEEDVQPDEPMQAALQSAVRDFQAYLGAEQIRFENGTLAAVGTA